MQDAVIRAVPHVAEAEELQRLSIEKSDTRCVFQKSESKTRVLGFGADTRAVRGADHWLAAPLDGHHAGLHPRDLRGCSAYTPLLVLEKTLS